MSSCGRAVLVIVAVEVVEDMEAVRLSGCVLPVVEGGLDRRL